MDWITIKWKRHHRWTWERSIVAHHAIADLVEFIQVLMWKLDHIIVFRLLSCSTAAYLWLRLRILVLSCSSLLLLTLSSPLDSWLRCDLSIINLLRSSWLWLWLWLTSGLRLSSLGLWSCRGLLSSMPLRYLLPWSSSWSSCLSCGLRPLLACWSSICLLTRITLWHLLHIHTMHLHCLHLRWELEIESHRLEELHWVSLWWLTIWPRQNLTEEISEWISTRRHWSRCSKHHVWISLRHLLLWLRLRLGLRLWLSLLGSRRLSSLTCCLHVLDQMDCFFILFHYITKATMNYTSQLYLP